MNQILSTDLKKKVNNKGFYKFQFIISITLVVVIIIFFSIYLVYMQRREKISKSVIDNYNIYKIYSNKTNYETSDVNSSNIFGIIEIPKINICYPIFSYLDENLLKIAPCKFNGNKLNQNDNICIAGHNYNNNMFFSNIGSLRYNDEIYIYDDYGKKYLYSVNRVYEVKYDDLSPIYNYDKSTRNLTLVTCTNLNSNRVILKAKQESIIE